MAQRLDLDSIYNDLNYNWWVDNQQSSGGAIWQSATIYYQDTIGNWHAFTSNGPAPENSDNTLDPTTREFYVKNYLMRDTALQLYDGYCAGGITNARPAAYQPMPIYGR